jgi:hypothetical protein
MRASKVLRFVLILLPALGIAGITIWSVYFNNPNSPWSLRETDETEHTEYQPPAPDTADVRVDDRLEDKKATFDPARVDPRPLGPKGEWLINNSAAIFRLDVPLIKPDTEANLLVLHPSYAAAIQAYPIHNQILPSVNLIDGKAKQFDDGLYAALDQAYYQGLEGKLLSHVALVRRIYDKAGKSSPAAPFLAAGLELAGVKVECADETTKQQMLKRFESNEVASKPIGFYTWNETLSRCFRFLRFFQEKLGEPNLAQIRALAEAIGKDKELLADYQMAMSFYARLTNPYTCLTVADVVNQPQIDVELLKRLAKEKKVAKAVVAFFPPSTSKETVLFEKLFPLGLPPNADLMRELVRRIRSGDVDLKPGPQSGWYDYQAYALETLLLPEKGSEHDKLLLTKAYKKRMLEAFQALLTKRRETHVRGAGRAKGAPGAMPPPLDSIKPRLRVEPCPSYFLRTARAYAFLASFLEAAVGQETLTSLHGLKQGGERAPDLYSELHQQRDLFYGLYLVSIEDLGMQPELARDEPVEEAGCRKGATDWLAHAFDDPDLAADTRVSVPIYADAGNNVTRLWATLGVRLARLDVSYARPPSLKPANGSKEWELVENHRLKPAEYLIPVDEFAEIELKGLRTLTRDELRAICDREKTKEAVLAALRR